MQELKETIVEICSRYYGSIRILDDMPMLKFDLENFLSAYKSHKFNYLRNQYIGSCIFLLSDLHQEQCQLALEGYEIVDKDTSICSWEITLCDIPDSYKQQLIKIKLLFDNKKTTVIDVVF